MIDLGISYSLCPKNVIIQAGGKGSRMEYYCHNKPKALLPINGKPLIYHAFTMFPNANFIIIGDYLFDVLERYLSIFPPNNNYQLIKTTKKGTCAGLQDALDKLPSTEDVFMMWCDLYFTQTPKISHDQDNVLTIFTTQQYDCRFQVEYNNNNISIIEKLGNHHGIIGAFYSKIISLLQNIPPQGEFVEWLADTDIPKVIEQDNHVKEFGTLDIFSQHWQNNNNPRFFNEITFKPPYAYKKCMNKEYYHLIQAEQEWYKCVKKYNFPYIPKIYQQTDNSISMEYIVGKHPFNITEPSQQYEILHDIINALKHLHDLDRIDANNKDLHEIYIEKPLLRISHIKQLYPNIEKHKTLLINNIETPNLLHTKNNDNNISEKLLLPKESNFFTIIHGDPTFSNIIIDYNNQLYFIDARGKFGDTMLYGDPLYDYAKLYYSMIGNYDSFNKKQFTLEIRDDGHIANITVNNIYWKHLHNIFEELCPYPINDIQKVHAGIWLSLCGYVTEDIDSMLAAFYLGHYYMQKAKIGI